MNKMNGVKNFMLRERNIIRSKKIKMKDNETISSHKNLSNVASTGIRDSFVARLKHKTFTNMKIGRQCNVYSFT